MWLRRILIVVVGLTLTFTTTTPSVAQESDDSDTPPTPTTIETVTLVTGDTVWVEQFSDGSEAVSIDAAPRRDAEPMFHTIVEDDEIQVIPSDAAPLIPELLDPELFNVSKLADNDYTDGVPVIVDHGESTARARTATAGMTSVTTLPSITATAAVIEPDGEWWDSVVAGSDIATTSSGAIASGPLAQVEKVWLDEQIKVSLDESVPLIGAPQAWDVGLDGTGTTIAVVDTGVDGDHPDLADQLVAQENFTDSDTPDDHHGHGTHVAGIAVGTGAASDGTFTGVAHGADLMNAKVLNDEGTGQTSWVIAGIEWAATEGADVINMSLGSQEPSDGTDPLSQTVNTIVEEHDVPIVVAAGNLGNGDQTIDAPAAADASLTVGSVTKTEFLAFGSSRGPRLGDFAIKPDVTGPGVAITSARAEGSDIGAPAGSDYQIISGTSMAAPHVAGTAAILLQANPDLTAEEIKARLAGTAVPRDIYDVYQQGGGRIDVPSALNAQVQATPSPVNLGYFPYPQENVEPVSKEVTYTNLTEEELTLDLSLDVASRDGAVPSEEMLSVEPGTLALAAGEEAAVTVTVDVTAGERGLYGGYIVASSGEETLTRTAVGFNHETEHYDLTIEGIARDGTAAENPSSFDVVDIDDQDAFTETSLEFVDGVGTVRLPPGNYSVTGVLFSGEEGATSDWAMVAQPEVEVSGDTTVVLDARDANPLIVDTPEHPEAVPIQHWTLEYRRLAEVGGFVDHRFIAPVTAFPGGTYAVESEPVTVGEFDFGHRTRQGTGEPATSVLYDLVFRESGVIPANLEYVADPDALVRLDNRFHSDASGHMGGEIRHYWTPGLAISNAEFEDLPIPAERVEYVVPGNRYQQSVFAQGTELGRMFEPITEYTEGEQRDQDWLKGPRRSGMREGGPFDISVVMTRLGDTLRMPLLEWADTNPGHFAPGDDIDTTSFRLFQEGELIAEGDRPPPFGVPVQADPATYRIEFDVARDAPWWTTSTETATAWTVRSERPPGPSFVALPLMMVDYEVDLDLQNVSPHPRDRRGPETVTVRARHQAGADGPPIAGARLWVSYDDGETWRARPGHDLGDDRFEFRLDSRDPIETSGFVALRVEAWDNDNNRIEQEILRAWRLPER